MADDIKSAREIALEKTDGLGEVPEAERLRWKYVPEGEKRANKCLNSGTDLTAELGRYEKKARVYLMEGAESVLLAGIGLPKNEAAKSKNEKAMAALKSIKGKKSAVAEIFGDIKRIFDHYTGQGEEQRKQAYEALKVDFKARLQRAVEQQLGSAAGMDINVEKLPQFQEEWRRAQAQLDAQYLNLLEEYKQELRGIK